MNIEEGKFYRTEAGDKVGPMVKTFLGKFTTAECGRLWLESGERRFQDVPGERIVAEWLEPANEIVWGEWVDHITGDQLIGDWQSQSVGGVQQFRFPVKREPVVETVVLHGAKYPTWIFDQSEHPKPTHRITLTIIDGVVQPTATVEALK